MKLFLRIAVLSWLGVTMLPAGDFQFVVIGDTRPRFESESFRPFEQLITRINALNPEMVINVGDLIYGYGFPGKEKQWDKYQAVIKQLQVPYYQLPGNHDTHSRSARRIYGRRFGVFYQSIDYQDCHFVLLDNTEAQRWGYMGPAELDWLRKDLRQTRARSVFVFMHFPIWEPERINPEYHRFWSETLHPLFRESRVKAVFGGHYHTYGPTREFDGIRYYITGGGGAELLPSYRRAGGEYHFMKVRVSGETFDVRVETERGELTDPEADVMGGLQFAARNVSRIGINAGPEQLRAGTTFHVTVENPYREEMVGTAEWIVDPSAFSVKPAQVAVQILPGSRRQYAFELTALEPQVTLISLPRLQFRVTAGNNVHRFHREVRLVREWTAPFRDHGPDKAAAWADIPELLLEAHPPARAALKACLDKQNLYLALTVPGGDTAEAMESGFSDEVQLGLARRRSATEFGNDLLRLGLSSSLREARDRTPGHKPDTVLRDVRSVIRSEGANKRVEVTIPLRRLKDLNLLAEGRLMLDLSFLVPEPEGAEPAQPGPNTFAYRVRYGSDSLVPVYFIELDLKRK